MPRLSNDPIGAKDLREYLDGYSDFSFELRTLHMLRGLGMSCEHGGLYKDPVTGKARQFDIRATTAVAQYRVRMAIECKNLRPNYPVLISCVPRHKDESYHEVAVMRDRHPSVLYSDPSRFSRAIVIRLTEGNSCYSVRAPVGKEVAQVGRSPDKTADIVASDADVFDKWTQSLASAEDLVCRSYSDPAGTVACVLPVLVVPDGRLWVAEYSSRGELVTPPTESNHCNLFVDKSYVMEAGFGPSLHVSHIDVMTSTGLATFVTENLTRKESLSTIFPETPIATAFAAATRDG